MSETEQQVVNQEPIQAPQDGEQKPKFFVGGQRPAQDGAGQGRDGQRRPFNRGNRDGRPGGFNRNRSGQGGQRSGPGGQGGNRPGGRDGQRRPRDNEADDNFTVEVIEVRRVTRVVKGGKRMRFSAMVVVGDKNGQVGFGVKKGLDFQDAVGKATKKAKDSLIKIRMNTDNSVRFTLKFKYKASQIFLKPAKAGTGIIAGGFIRPVLELAGIQNVYSKIVGSRNKISGVQAVVEALKQYA